MWRQRPIKRRPSHRKLRSECAKNEILVYIAQVGKWYVSISKRYKSLYIIFVENNQFNIKRKDISHFFAKIIQHNFFLPETQRKWSNKLVDDPWPSTRYVALDLFQPQQGDRLSQHLQRHFLSQTKLQVERYCLFHTLICIHRLQKSPFCFLKFRQYFKSLFFLRWYIETNWYIFYSLKLAGCGISVSWIICRPRRKIKMCLYELHMTSIYKLQRKLNDRQRGSTTLRMWGWLTFSDLRRQCPRCHIDTAAVLLVLYMLIKQIFNYIVDFRRQDGHYRQMTFFTDQYLKCCCQFQKHNLKTFNAPNILPLPLICRGNEPILWE